MSKSYSGPVASSRTAFGQIKSFAFAAPWWAKNRHVQTIYGRYFGQHPTIAFEPERVELEDGDFIDLAWAPKPTQCKGLLILFHGLEGSKDSHYIKHAVYVLSQQYHCVVMHFRGCSGAINRTHRAYHRKRVIQSYHFSLQMAIPNNHSMPWDFLLAAICYQTQC